MLCRLPELVKLLLTPVIPVNKKEALVDEDISCVEGRDGDTDCVPLDAPCKVVWLLFVILIEDMELVTDAPCEETLDKRVVVALIELGTTELPRTLEEAPLAGDCMVVAGILELGIPPKIALLELARELCRLLLLVETAGLVVLNATGAAVLRVFTALGPMEVIVFMIVVVLKAIEDAALVVTVAVVLLVIMDKVGEVCKTVVILLVVIEVIVVVVVLNKLITLFIVFIALLEERFACAMVFNEEATLPMVPEL